MQPTNSKSTPRANRHRLWAISFVALSFILNLGLVSYSTPSATAQDATLQIGSSSLPQIGYYAIFPEFYRADYKRALKNYQSASNRAYRVGNRRFIDSCCYWTMIGECFYQLGDYENAMQAYNRSLTLYLEHSDGSWQARLSAPPTGPQADPAAIQKARISWGTSTRRFKVINDSSTYAYEFGDRGAVDRALIQGGAIFQAEKRAVDVREIMRCVALAMHRRRTILGPTCKFDNLTTRLSTLPGGAGSEIGAMNGVLRGIAQASAEEWQSATATLTAALQVTGGFDHELTPVALLELALIQMQTGNEKSAINLAVEASYSAALFEQFDLVEESLSVGTTAHLTQSKTPFPPLKNAIAWAVREKYNLTAASLMVRLADCYSEAGDFKNSNDVLSQTRRPMSRNSLGNSVVNTRRNYVSAVNQFLQGDSTKGYETLGKVLTAYNKYGSKWLYQLRSTNAFAVGGESPRKADQLYSALLRDPSDSEWQHDPLEAITFLKSDHLESMELWFEIVVERRDFDRALEISELLRRHRFFSSLPLGGRLLAFRWVVHSPEKGLSPDALAQRKAFVKNNPTYQASIVEANKTRVELLALPTQPDEDSDELKKQRKLFISMFNISKTQEAVLASFALRRSIAEQAFPPKRDMAKFRKSLPEKQVAFVTVASRGGYHVFKLDKKQNTYIKKHDGRGLNRSIGKLMAQLGVSNSTVEVDDLREDEWKESAKGLGKLLLGESSVEDWDGIQQLVVIPDGALWYLPFELLMFGDEGAEVQVREKLDVRYSPTLFLAFNEQRKFRPIRRTAVVSSKMHPKLPLEQTQQAFEKFKVDMPDAVKLEEKINITTNFFGAVLDQLVVWSDIRIGRDGIYSMAPAQLDKGAGSTLGSWMSLPWWGPEHVVLPGFSSSAGKSKADGTELFLASCGFMASGTRSLLISRWRVGGENSLELTREFAKRQPRERGIVALRQAVDAARQLKVNFENEPRLKPGKNAEALKADHPFFWAGHMLMEIPRTPREADAGG